MTTQDTSTMQLAVLPHPATSPSALMLDSTNMDSMIRVAELMSSGRSTIPVHLQKNPADCMAVVMQSIQWRMNPFVVAQKTHVVNGTLGYEAQLVNAVITTMAPTKDRLHFDWFGNWKGIDGKTNKSDDIGVKVWATIKGEDEPRTLEVTMAQAGVRNSPLWVQDPRLQLAYLAIKRWARLYTPDVILGVYTPDEFDKPAEQHMGSAVQVQKPVIYPADKFKENLPAWQKVIQSARKTADQIITMAETKHPLSDEQKAQIRAIPAVEEAKIIKPVITYAEVAAKLHQANSVDSLDAAADLIGEINDPEQRKELSAKYEILKTAFTK